MGTLSKYCVTLDGSNEYISIGNVAPLNFDRLSTFSISAWILLSGTTGVYTIFSKMEALPTYRGWGLFVDNQRLKFQHVSDWGAANRLEVMTTDVVIPQMTWKHVVVTTDGTGTAAGVKIYVDGVEITSKTTTYDTLSATTIGTGVATIGRRSSAADLYWPGSIDEVAAYNITLSSPQVTTIFNNDDPPNLTTVGPTGNLVGYWKIGDGDTYPTATDSSTNANNGTYTNTESTDLVLYGAGVKKLSGIPASVNGSSVMTGTWRYITETGLTSGAQQANVYLMMASDSVTQALYSWVVTGTPDWAGTNYPGPNSPTNIAIGG